MCGLELGNVGLRFYQPWLVCTEVVVAEIALYSTVPKVADICLDDRDQFVPAALGLRQVAFLRQLLQPPRRDHQEPGYYLGTIGGLGHSCHPGNGSPVPSRVAVWPVKACQRRTITST